MGLKVEKQEREYCTAVQPSGKIPCFVDQAVKRSHLSSYMQFAQCLLGAAASLEISSEKPAAWKCTMQASMCADGMASHPRCNLVETAGLDSMEETKVDPHRAGSGEETTAERGHQWSDQNDFALLSSLKFLNHLVQQENQRKHVH